MGGNVGMTEDEKKIKKLLATIEWMVNLAHDTGKSGGRPRPGEWRALLAEGEAHLEEARQKEAEAKEYPF
jgi:hypothetical protein